MVLPHRENKNDCSFMLVSHRENKQILCVHVTAAPRNKHSPATKKTCVEKQIAFSKQPQANKSRNEATVASVSWNSKTLNVVLTKTSSQRKMRVCGGRQTYACTHLRASVSCALATAS